MKNLIILGDSFCSNKEFWPSMLAESLDRRLICYTEGAGQSWWAARTWLENLEQTLINDCDIMVFAHTNADRIPTSNLAIGRVNHSAKAINELEQSVQLYYKYIHAQDFLHWAQQQWFRELSESYGSKCLVHLHCFPWTLQCHHLLKGLNVTTNLAALSLNELGATEFALYSDSRPNHLNPHNNNELANQLTELLLNYHEGTVELDISRFDQKINDWLTKTEWN